MKFFLNEQEETTRNAERMLMEVSGGISRLTADFLKTFVPETERTAE
jgi:hypothetical protein